jgi:hypothetical protein
LPKLPELTKEVCNTRHVICRLDDQCALHEEPGIAVTLKVIKGWILGESKTCNEYPKGSGQGIGMHAQTPTAAQQIWQ